MKETQDIIAAAADAGHRGLPAALATVVSVDGSAYRKPGARMLVTKDGPVAGSVSGGCLEADVVGLARRVIDTREPALAAYDTTGEQDIVFGSGMGCQGIVRILIEPCPTAAIAWLAEQMARRQACAMAAVYAADHALGLPLGTRFWTDGGAVAGTSRAEFDLAASFAAEACGVLGTEAARSVTWSADRGAAQALVEGFLPPPALLIAGAGLDVPPLVLLAKSMGWHVTVTGERLDPAAAAARFPGADAVISCAPEALREHLLPGGPKLAILMSHDYLSDLRALQTLASAGLDYLGVVGSRARMEKLRADLGRDCEPGAALTAAISGPAGLEIGAEGPYEIALSVVAEIQRTMSAARGGRFRNSAA